MLKSIPAFPTAFGADFLVLIASRNASPQTGKERKSNGKKYLMKSSRSLFASLLFSVALHATNSSSKAASLGLTKLDTTRTVVGSLADVFIEYRHAQLISVAHILDFRTDDALKEPALLQIRLCGDQTSTLYPLVHTNLTLVYDASSPSRSTGCLRLLRAAPWQDGGPWPTIGLPRLPLSRSK
jgi:hypothetical protein